MQQEGLSIDDSTLQSIPKNKPFISLFSGGKDSGLALSMACEVAQPMALIHCMDDERSIHHIQSKETIEQQASSLNIPVVFYNNHWTKWPKLIKLFQHYKQKGAEFVVYGDLFREDNAQLQITLCRSAGLIPCMPLWHIPYEILLNEMETRNITSIITVIKSSHIELHWLGKVFNRYAYENFSNLEIDAFGEYGEFHTTLINADIFKYPLKYQTREDDNGIINLEIINEVSNSE